MPVSGRPASTATGAGSTVSPPPQAWFLGDNDGQHVMWDPETGGGYDGLTPTRTKPQPGCRVDPRPDLDDAARASGS